MKYAIYGAGSLGLIFAAYLAKNNEAFDLIDRNIKSVEAINKNGIEVTGHIKMHEKVSCILDTEVKDKYDIIFLYTKQLNNIESITKISKYLNDGGVICTMQNGLPEKDVALVIGNERTFGATVGWGATRLDYGVSELTSDPGREYMSFNFGSFDGHKDKYFDEIVRILNVMGKTTIEENFIGGRFTKLLINSAFSGVSTVCGGTFGETAKNKKSRKIIQAVIKECIDVAKAANIKCEPMQGKDVVKLMDYKSNFKKVLSLMIIPLAIRTHKDLKPGMLEDYKKGIPCEVDYINGAVSEYGRKYNVPTPTNDMVVELIHKFEKGELKPSFDNVKYFNEK